MRVAADPAMLFASFNPLSLATSLARIDSPFVNTRSSTVRLARECASKTPAVPRERLAAGGAAGSTPRNTAPKSNSSASSTASSTDDRSDSFPSSVPCALIASITRRSAFR